MGISLYDPVAEDMVFEINFWHWRAIVAAIERLGVVPPRAIEILSEPFVGGISKDEARIIAAALRADVLPTMQEGERMLLEGGFTRTPDDGVFHREPDTQAQNYSTNREVMERFIVACETCNGFDVG
jgi:hypothetical protein